jgi:hypothetical protein
MIVDKAEEERKDKAGKEQNDFINQRLTWLGTFEGLLFVADHYGAHPCWLLPSVGAAFAISVGVGTYAANLALIDLGRQAFQNDSCWFRKHVLVHCMPGTAIPAIVTLAWLVLLFDRVWHHS